MSGDAWLAAAAHLPAPIFVLIVAGLATFSIGGFPVPITATLLLAGALTTRLPNGPLLFAVLLVVLTAALTARDGVTLLLGRHGERLWRRRSARAAALAASSDGLAVRSASITLPAARVMRQARRRAARAKTLAAAQAMLLHQGAVVLALTRLSPLASPFDIAAGMLGMPLRRFIPPIAVGRSLYSVLLLGAGALSATAWGRGASLPQLVGIISVVLIAFIILPGVLSRRAMAQAVASEVPDEADVPALAPRSLMSD